MKLYGVVGCGGFGREVMPLAEATLKFAIEFLDAKLVFISEQKPPVDIINNYKVLTMEEYFSEPASEKYFNIAIASYVARKRIAESMISLGAKPFSIKAANHVELAHNSVEEGAIFCPFTTITSNTQVGKFFHANIYSYVAHDCKIGDYVTFAPNVHCNGNVIIEDEVYVGTGVIIREGTSEKPMVIGKGAVLGMGAVITKSVPAYETVVGNPAKPLKQKINSM